MDFYRKKGDSIKNKKLIFLILGLHIFLMIILMIKLLSLFKMKFPSNQKIRRRNTIIEFMRNQYQFLAIIKLKEIVID